LEEDIILLLNTLMHHRTWLTSSIDTSLLKKYGINDEYIGIYEQFRKDDKIDFLIRTETIGKEPVGINTIWYTNTIDKEQIILMNNTMQAYITTDYTGTSLPLALGVGTVLINEWSRLFNIKSIKTQVYNNKKYYVVSLKGGEGVWDEYWIDKETFLTFRDFRNINGRDVEVTFKYEFDNVTDQDVSRPDLTEYTIK